VSAPRIKRKKSGPADQLGPTVGGVPLGQYIQSQIPYLSRMCALCSRYATFVGVFLPTGPARHIVGHDVVLYRVCDECRAAPGCVDKIEAALFADARPVTQQQTERVQ
jgi:hypothetical protein